MDFNEYALEHEIRERLARARTAASRRALVPATPRRLRAALGARLVALGERQIGAAPAAQRSSA